MEAPLGGGLVDCFLLQVGAHYACKHIHLPCKNWLRMYDTQMHDNGRIFFGSITDCGTFYIRRLMVL
jgi:hypothetical protein